MLVSEWVEKAVSSDSFMVNRNTSRCSYETPNKVKIWETTTVPHSFLKKISTTYLVDLLFKKEEVFKYFPKYGGIYIEHPYTSKEDYGFIQFDSLEAAYLFATREKDNITSIARCRKG